MGATGVVVPAKDPDALAQAMLCIMRMKESERCDTGKAARARIVRHFDMNAKAAEWQMLYSGLLRGQVTGTHQNNP